MQQFGRIFFKGLLCLAAATIMAAALQAQAAPNSAAGGSQSDPAVLAQGSEPLKGQKVSSPPAPKKTTGQKKSPEPGKGQIKKKSGKGVGGARKAGGAGGGHRSGAGRVGKGRPSQEPGAAGTRKIGGQIVRDKEGPPEE
jgi:hypothetical protein